MLYAAGDTKSSLKYNPCPYLFEFLLFFVKAYTLIIDKMIKIKTFAFYLA